ncbi:MAG: hypothetical protein HC888_00510 [Candidatus Competibacteraceae bacterium]|nr:hypothetical protein [Candidatus Competibacteraceae bacterium]
MAVEQYANNSATTLNGAINDSVTTITVADGSVFPSSGDFRIVIDDEILLVTARSTNDLTVTRGVENTTAASHSDSADVTHILSRQSLLNIVRDSLQTGAYSSRPAASREGELYFSNNTPLISRSNGSAWSNWGPIFNLTHPGVLADYTDLTASTTGVTYREADTNAGFTLGASSTSINARRYKARVKAIPSTPRTLTVGFMANYRARAVSMYAGIWMWDSVNTRGIMFMMSWQTVTNTFAIAPRSHYYSSFADSTSPTVLTISDEIICNDSLCFLRLVDDGTDLSYQVSNDNELYYEIATELSGARLAAPTHWGPGVFVASSNNVDAHFMHVLEA